MKNLNLSFLIITALFAASQAGTPCPQRNELYPCICMNMPQSKTQVYTVVTCRHVPNKNSFSAIFKTLESMRIDKFVMYDSFWDVDALNISTEVKDVQKQLPENFLTLLMIRDIEIQDSKLSSCFACDITASCPNRFVSKLSIFNSTSSVDVCPTCNRKRWWTACLPELKTLDFSRNSLKTIDKDLFLQPMQKMTHLNFSYNEISTVGDEAFRNLPKIVSIDLSHNKIIKLDLNIFNEVSNSLTHLDVSYNMLTKLSSNIFKFTPKLRILSATHNAIKKVLLDDWKHLSREIRSVDLTGNPLNCDCHMVWLNCTTKVHVQFHGYCLNEGFDSTPLRRVSKYVSERCVNDQLLERKLNKTTERTACQELLQKQSQTVQLLDLNRVAPNRRDRKPLVTPKSV